MSAKDQSASRQAGGLKPFKNNATQAVCKTANRPYLKAKDEKAKVAYYIRPDCKLWSCEACAARRRRLWVFTANYGGDALLAQGRNLSFVTLTSARNVRTLKGGIWVWRRAWPKLSARWRRAANDLQYVYVPEHKAGSNFHVHLITTSELPTRWYKDNGAQTGLGYQAKAVPIVSATECGGYLGKYLGKALATMSYPKYFRRVNSSRGWPRPEEVATPYVWEMVGNDPSKVIFLIEVDREEGWLVEHSLEEFEWRR